MKKLVACFFLVLCSLAHAGPRAASVSSPDPFRFTEIPGTCNGALWNCNQPYGDTHGRTPKPDQTINPAIRNLILISAGQSLRENQTPTTFVPTHLSAIDNFNVLDGAVYPYLEPCLGTGYTGTTTGFGTGYLIGRVADKFISGGQFDRVILVPLAVGGSSVANWATGYLADRIPKAMARLAARSFVAGTNVTVAIEWGQGEADNQGGTSQAAYTTALNTVIANARAAGFTGRFFVAQETMFNGATSSAVAAAQAAIPNGTTIFASGNIDSLSTADRINNGTTDLGTHLNDAGAAAAATLIFNAMHASGAPF